MAFDDVALRVLVLVVHVVFVLMVVLLSRVSMQVRMLLGQMQPDTHGHQRTRHQQARREWFAEPPTRARHRRRVPREVSAGARRAEVPQCHNEQGQADAVGHEPEEQCSGDPGRTRQPRRHGRPVATRPATLAGPVSRAPAVEAGLG